MLPWRKSELVDAIEQGWAPLAAWVAARTPAELEASGADGAPSAKRQIAHLMAWERGMLTALRGEGRPAGLGVSAEVAARGDDNEINHAIDLAHRDRPAVEVVAEWRQAHQALVAEVRALSEAELLSTAGEARPGVAGLDPYLTLLAQIWECTGEHYAEHAALFR